MESITVSSAMPSHTGLLRDEILFLRQLLGYCDNEIELLNSSLLPHSSARLGNMKNVRFLGIDIDALQEHERVIQQFHIGISVLDTHSLQALVLGLPDARLATQVIESHHFIVGNSGFSQRKSNKFIFRQPETFSLSDLRRKLRSLTLHRDVVLVFHGSNRELGVFTRLDIDLQPLCIIDTVKAAQYPLQLSYRYSLEKLLTELGIPFVNLHVSGNDAHFVLRALLMIAVRDAERELETSALPCWLPIFREITQLSPTKAVEVPSAIISQQNAKKM